MDIATIIKVNRLKQKLTQEQVANYLTITTPAVNKWERGVSYPDITLLAPLARLLHIDLNELLDFRPILSEEELEKYLVEFRRLLMEGHYDKLMEEILTAVSTYPTSEKLLLDCAMILKSLPMYRGVPNDEKTSAKVMELLQRCSQSADQEITEAACQILYYEAIHENDFEAAAAALAKIVDHQVDKSSLQAHFELKQGRNQSAETMYQRILLKKAHEAMQIISFMIEAASNEQDKQRIAYLKEKMADLGAAFELASVLIEAYQLQENESISTELAAELADFSWDPTETELFRGLAFFDGEFFTKMGRHQDQL